MSHRGILAAAIVVLAQTQTACSDRSGESAPRASEPPLYVAVASNFAETARELAQVFERDTGYSALISTGSTGKLYHQIRRGGPYHVFLSADAERPRRLVREGSAKPSSLVTYAVGRLVLWVPSAGAEPDCLQAMLDALPQGPVSIANPVTAPYGLAARQALQHLDMLKSIEDDLVMGENISQAYLFVASGNASSGFIARSQAGDTNGGCALTIDSDTHSPLVQDALITRDHPAAESFMSFIQGPAGRKIISRHGYDLPTEGKNP